MGTDLTTLVRLRLRAYILALGLLACHAPPPRYALNTPVQLTSEPGCEEFPSFTPDGRTVVYDHSIDHGFGIFAIDLNTKKRERLSMQSESVWDFWERWDYAPVVSPDGRRIAHLRDSSAGTELWSMPVAGDAHGDPTNLGIVADAEPIWRDERTVIVLGKSNQVLAVSADTGERRVLATIDTAYEVYGFIALAGGALAIRVARADSSMRSFSMWILRNGKLSVLPLGDGAFEQLRFKGGLASLRYDGFYQARGSRIDAPAFLHRPIRGGKGEVIASIPATMGFAISPNRKQLVYSACYEYGAIARIERDRPVVELTPRSTDVLLDVRAIGDDRVAYTALGKDVSEVRMLDLAAPARPAQSYENIQELRRRNGAEVYVRHDGQRGLGVHLRVGDREERLTADAEDNSPAFTHDGAAIVFLRGARTGEGAKLHRVWRDRAAEPIAVPATDAFAVSPTGDTIVFATMDDPALYVTTLAGSTPRPLLASGGKGSFQDLVFAPDGKHVAVIRGQKELLELAIDGKSDPVLVADAGYLGLRALDYAPDGRGFIAALRIWDGDLWIADGWLP